MDQLLRKRTVLVLVLLGSAVLLVSGSRVWLQGTVNDAVLGASALRGKGSQVAPGVLAAALVSAAAVVAAATSGRVVRVVSAWATALAGVLAGVLIGAIMVRPGDALGTLAATTTGRTGSVPAHGSITAWVWVAAVAAIALWLGGMAAIVGGHRWSGLSSRYEAPAAADGKASRGRGRRRPESAWDQISRGEDPTSAPGGDPSSARAGDPTSARAPEEP